MQYCNNYNLSIYDKARFLRNSIRSVIRWDIVKINFSRV